MAVQTKSKAKKAVKRVTSAARKPKKQSSEKVQATVQKILAKHKQTLAKKKVTKPKKAKEPKPVFNTVVIHEARPQRKRLKGGGPSKEMRTIASAQWAAVKAKNYIREREAQGLPPLTVTLKTPARQLLALQVRDSRDPEWGTLKAFTINSHTPSSQLDKYRAELRELQIDWIVSNYFGSDAMYRICVVHQDEHCATY